MKTFYQIYQLADSEQTLVLLRQPDHDSDWTLSLDDDMIAVPKRSLLMSMDKIENGYTQFFLLSTLQTAWGVDEFVASKCKRIDQDG